MKVSEAKDFIKGIAGKAIHVPVLLCGAMGVGKSAIVKQAAQELGIGIIDLRLAQQEPGDLIGIPRAVGGKTEWAKPSWWPEEGTKGILFLDELNRAPVDVRQAVFQLVNEWRMHTHKLPDGWYIVSAINPDNNNYQVETLDPAMLRRFCVIGVTPDVETWLKWAHGAGAICKELTGFVAANRNLLFVPEDFSFDLKPTPDQYRMLNDLMAQKSIPKELEIEVFIGLIGKEPAITLRRWLDSNFDRPAAGEDVFNHYSQDKKLQEKVKKQRSDEMWSTVSELVAVLENNKKPTKGQIANLIKFIKDVSAESQATLVKKLPREYLTEIVSDDELTDKISKIMKESKT